MICLRSPLDIQGQHKVWSSRCERGQLGKLNMCRVCWRKKVTVGFALCDICQVIQGTQADTEILQEYEKDASFYKY